MPAFGLANDTAVITALCNDIGVDVVFARQIAAFGGQHDIAVALSTSGNSENLLRGLDEAARRGMLTVGIAGYDGGRCPSWIAWITSLSHHRRRCTGSKKRRPPFTTRSGNSRWPPSATGGGNDKP